jgi:sodium/hydrogen antiporter
MSLVACFLVVVFAYALVSRRLEGTVVTAPIVFTLAGMAVAGLRAPRAPETTLDVLLTVAEIGLVLLLFADASRTDLKLLKNIRNLPVRLLTTGLLSTILLGALAALLLFRQLSVWEAGVLGAILAPTDAGLGQVIVTSERVPLRIRQALNVEAGLNDGLAVPFLLFFIAMAGPGRGDGRTLLVPFIVQQLGFGAAIGVGIGLAGGWLLGVAERRGSVSSGFEQMAVVALPLGCAFASEATHASMFIAAFVAGLSAQLGFARVGQHGVEFAEQWGQLFNLSIFFLFGLLAARSLHELSLSMLLYAVLSLTVVRMLPVAIALYGSGLSKASVLFMGWFGPRGLASIVLGLVYLEQQTQLGPEDAIRLTVMLTVLLSIFAHGLSAIPGSKLYAARVQTLGANAPEREGVPPSR